MQNSPTMLHPAHFSHLQTREFDPYWMTPPTFASPGPARALDFMNSLPSNSMGASGGRAVHEIQSSCRSR